MPSATMKTMKKCAILMALLLSVGAFIASAQEPPSSSSSDETHECILAKRAAEDGHFDDALATIDKLVTHHPDNVVLLYERAMIRIDAGRRDDAESDLRKAVAANATFYDAQRVLGRMLLDRAGSDRTKIEEALPHLQAAYKLNPDDLVSGMTVAQIFINTKRPAEAEKVLATLLERAPDPRALNYNYALVLMSLNREPESRQYLEKAVLLDATFTPAVLQLIDVYQKD